MRSIATALVALTLALSACGPAQNAAFPLAGATQAARAANARPNTPPRFLYVANQVRVGGSWKSTINVYRAVLSGNVAPVRVIGGSNTDLSEVNGIAVDRSGEIYVIDTDTATIVGFAANARGDVLPNVRIAGKHTHLAWPVGLAVDRFGHLYVADCASYCRSGSSGPAVLEFDTGARGDATPIRIISGSRTKLSYANAIALDIDQNIYISNIDGSNTIDVFAAEARGNTGPTRVVAGYKTLLDGPLGIAVDTHGIYAGSNYGNYIERFAPDADHDVAPVAEIAGSQTELYVPDGITVDARGVLYSTSNGSIKRILEFTPLANGDVKPFGQISGSRTKLVGPAFLFVM